MKRLKTIPPRTWLAIACALLCAAAAAARAWAVDAPDSQLAAGRWQAGDTPYVQVSAFISEDAAFIDNNVLSVRQTVDEALAAASQAAESENARLWIDAYSAETTVSVENEYNTQSARAICTGGDFFQLHPLEMVSGWYYTGEESTDTVVVLDESLAWKLFGSEDAAGMSLYINGYACTVAGVAKTPQNSDEQEAYGSEATLYLPYSFLQRQESGAPPLTCYEAVLPEPVTGFGLETIENALSLGEGDYEMRQNTGRFGFASSLRVAAQYEARSQRRGRIYYPWWENAARAMESRSALLVVLMLIFAAYPAVYILIIGILYGRRGLLKLKRRKRKK